MSPKPTHSELTQSINYTEAALYFKRLQFLRDNKAFVGLILVDGGKWYYATDLYDPWNGKVRISYVQFKKLIEEAELKLRKLPQVAGLIKKASAGIA